MENGGVPLPGAIGRYAVERELGAGGMSTVYLARDTEAGAHVAVKVLHPWLGLSESALKRFRREAQAGVSIEHANVVRTLDIDRTRDAGPARHYLVMEYVEGKTLRALLDDLGRVPETLLREIARQLAEGLRAIHARGILHRDLKPENLLISDDECVRIMDLGVAKLVEATVQLTSEGQFIGSLAYAAPEQFTDDELGAPADLYSLGVVLYELACGHNPFRFEQPLPAIRAHQDLVPEPLPLTEPAISPFFGGVVATLLAKDPEQRFASCTELLDVLATGEGSDWWQERRQGEAVVPVERDTALHGRAAESAALDEAWARARGGDGCAVMLIGEAGSGKSRLVGEFLAQLSDTGVHTLYGSFGPEGGFGGLLDAVRGRFGRRDALAGYLESEALRDGLAAQLTDEPERALGTPELGAALARLLEGMARERPVVWIIDDLHFARAEARRVVDGLARAASGQPVLLIVTSRGDVRLGDSSARAIELGRLDTAAVADLLAEQLSNKALAEHLAGPVAARSDGIPLYVLGILRAMVDQGVLRRSPDGAYDQARRIEDLETPDALRDLIEQRLGAIGDLPRRILDAASVHGAEFDPELVGATLDLPLVALLQELADLERGGGLVRSAGRHYRFDHHLVQEALYGALADRLRDELHAQVADALLQRAGESVSGAVAENAVHHLLRGSRPEAVLKDDLLEQALQRAAGRADVSLDIATRALAVPGLLDGPRRAAALINKAQAADVLGLRAEQRLASDEALAIARSENDDVRIAEAHLTRAIYHLSTTEHEDCLRQTEQGLEYANKAGVPRLQMRAMTSMGVALARLGRADEAREYHARARQLARDAGDKAAEALAANNIALGLANAGNFRDAAAMAEESIRLGEEVGSVRTQAYAQGNLGLMLMKLGRYEEAGRGIARHRALAIECGDLRSESIANGNLGAVYRILGRFDDARLAARRHAALAREVGDRNALIVHHSNVAAWHEQLGDYDRAMEENDKGTELATSVGNRSMVALIRCTQARLHVKRGELERAVERGEEAVALAREVGRPEVEVDALLSLATACAATGDAERARVLLAKARPTAKRTAVPSLDVQVRVRLGVLTGDLGGAREALAWFGQQVDPAITMELHHLLYQADGNRADLDAAHTMLEQLRAAAPKALHEALESAPLHKSITQAHGT
ncbi:MAG: protein kinase domain-containing protein [Planctomycetota bacterium]